MFESVEDFVDVLFPSRIEQGIVHVHQANDLWRDEQAGIDVGLLLQSYGFEIFAEVVEEIARALF